MNILTFPELFCSICANLNDKEKIFLISCSKITYNFKSLLILHAEYILGEINYKWRVKNIIIKYFALWRKIKELIENLIPESIVVNSKYVKFISNNMNIKLFYDEEIIEKLVSYECDSYLMMKIMLNNDESIDNINEQFIYASLYGYSDIVKLLIKSGANIHTQNNRAIIEASRLGNLSMVKLLIEFGADINAKNNQAIIEASRLGNLSIVELLIESGADIHAQDNQAIISASIWGYTSVVKLLICSGADIHARNDKALKCAEQFKYPDIIKLLKIDY